MRRLLLILTLVLAFAGFGGEARADKRIALVIGNGAYKTVASLPNPSRDARAIADLLRAAKFDEVTLATDLGIIEMRAKLRDFARRAGVADIAVVYYAGHGIEVAGHNYLVPVDAKLEYETDAEDEAVDLDRVLRDLEPAKRLKLVILDACRENPFAPQARAGATREIRRGLAPLSRDTTDTLVAYAAAVGATAADGDGAHSPFTSALLDNLTLPGKDIRLALGKVRDEVLTTTGGRQVPFITGSLGGDDLWLAPPLAPPPPVISPEQRQQAAFEAAMRVDTVAALETFLSQFPGSPNADIVRRERERLRPAPIPSPSVAPTPDAAVVAARKEEAAFETAMRADTIAALDGFLAQYPESGSADIARRERERLRPAPVAPPTAAPTPDAAIAARERLAAFETAMRVDTIASLDAFLAQYPGSASADVVRRERARLAPPQAPAVTPSPSPTMVASLPDPRAIAVSVEAELRRLGCYGGGDAEWGSAPVRWAIAKYARFARLDAAPTTPDADLLNGLKSRRDRVCPPECGVRDVAVNGRCVVKTCPPGELLSREGTCYARPAPPPAPAPVPVARKPTIRERRAAEPAEVAPTREVAKNPAPAPKGHCFSFNGSQYCE